MSHVTAMEAGLLEGAEKEEGVPLLLPPLEAAPAPTTRTQPQNPLNRKMRQALRRTDVSAVKRLLAEDASLAYRHLTIGDLDLNDDKVTALDILCNSLDNSDSVERINIFHVIWTVLEQEKKLNDILEHLDGWGHSHLYQAIHRGHLEVIQTLLRAGASVEHVDKREGVTALYVAVERPSILKYFLDNLDITLSEKLSRTRNEYGYAAIHEAAKEEEVDALKLLVDTFGEEQLNWRTSDGSTVLHIGAACGSVKVVEYLIRFYNYPVSCKDNSGDTPLNRSVEEGHRNVTALLLSNGAVLSQKDHNGITAVEHIARKFDEPTKFLEDIFDEHFNEKHGRVPKFCVDYGLLTNPVCGDMSQIQVIEKLVACGLGDLLKHPLLHSLIYLKWRYLLPVFYSIIIMYAIFLVLFNTFLVHIFYTRDRCNDSFTYLLTDPETACFECFNGWDYWMWVTLIYLSIFLLFAQECIYIYLQWRRYIVHLESWVKICLLALAAVVPLGTRCAEPAAWLRHVACAALLLSWLQAMFLLSRFPNWGYYVLMFERVAYNMFKILLTSICLIIGFSFCFMIQYRSKPPFDGPGSAFIKTLVMMLSEFDYQDLLGEDNEDLQDTKPVVRLLFVIFVIFIAIVLMNFMVGVAVSDTNELNVIGNIRRLEKQMELLSSIESFGESKLAKTFPRLSCLTYFHNITKDIQLEYKSWDVRLDKIKGQKLTPQDYTQSLPSELQNAIIDVVTKNENYLKNKQKNKLDAVYDAVVGNRYIKTEDALNGKQEKEEKVPQLIEKIELLENSVKEMKRSIDDLKEDINKILTNSNNEMKQSIEDLKNNMKVVLAILTIDINSENRVRVDRRFANSESSKRI